MTKREFIPIPPPAPIPDAENVDAAALLRAYQAGDTDLICVMGPTASGKTRFAVALAREFNRLIAAGPSCGLAGAEILSGDSRQVYRGMDIGTGKDLAEYGEIPYHLIDIVPAGFRYDICRYQRDFSKAYGSCRSRGVIPILCGGSGLYIEAVTRPGYEMKDNEDLALYLPEKTWYMATVVDRETRRARIDRRLDERLEGGMIEEIKQLLDSGIPAETLIYYGLEYKYLTQHVIGETDAAYMKEHLKIAIHKFAKRQMTWLRGMEKDGVRIHWVDAGCLD